ncbi:hypothetical protein [Olleya sp. R77988]|uniref:hypothetical protein n=1 Tax=Olleya sp. R77988 TaxID=3093875 RepID=UPI0037C5B080
MKKIEFMTLPKYGDKVVKTIDENYILLSYYLSDRRDIKSIDIALEDLLLIKNEEKTFEEIWENEIVPISVSAGEFECDKDTAYFISDNPDAEPSIEMPLQELIDLLEEWKAFLSS